MEKNCIFFNFFIVWCQLNYLACLCFSKADVIKTGVCSRYWTEHANMAQTVNMGGRTNTYGAEYRYWDFYVKCTWYCWNLIRANALTFWLSCQDRAHSFRSSRVSGLTIVYTSELQRGPGQTKNCSTLSKKGPQPRQLARLWLSLPIC